MQNGSTRSVEALNGRMGEEIKKIITVKTDLSERSKQGKIDLPVMIRIGSKFMIDNQRIQFNNDRINIDQ